MDVEISLFVGGTLKEGAKEPVYNALPVNLEHQQQGFSEMLFHCIRFTKCEKFIHVYVNVD